MAVTKSGGGKIVNKETVLRLYHMQMQDLFKNGTDATAPIAYAITLFCDRLMAEMDEAEEAEEVETSDPTTAASPTKNTLTRKRLTPHEVQRIYNLSDLGKSQFEIATSLNRSPSVVCRVLKTRTAVKKGEPGKGNIDWMRDLSAQGLTVEQISDKTGWAQSVVSKYIGGANGIRD